MSNNIKQENGQLNFISVLGFACSLLSIPLFFLCVVQLVALGLSAIGLQDTKKCGNRGAGFAVLGLIISSVIIIITPIIIIYAINYGISYADVDINLLLKVLYEFFRLL